LPWGRAVLPAINNYYYYYYYYYYYSYSGSLLTGHSCVRTPIGRNGFSVFQNSSWPPLGPTLHQKHAGSFPRSEAAGAWRWPSTPSSADV